MNKSVEEPQPLSSDEIRYFLDCLVGKSNRPKCHVVPMDEAGNPPYRSGDLIYNSMSDGCSNCGYPFDTQNNGTPSYCPNCGAEVIKE